MPSSQSAPSRPDHEKISLIVATLGRREELTRLLTSLTRQSLPPHEVIIVDQNPEGWLETTVAPFRPHLPLLVLRSAKGASRARNVGLTVATGAVLGFPDDDCWLAPALLRAVADGFNAPGAPDALCLPLADENDRPIMLRWPVRVIPVTRGNVWQTCLMAGFYARRSTMSNVGGFDEQLGVGASSNLSSGEETDLALRLLAAGHHLEFHPLKGLHHPPRPPVSALAGRAESYGRGFGYVWTRHKLPIWGFYYYCLRAFGGLLLARLTRDTGAVRYYTASLTGRRAGRAAALKTPA
ncbi:MAG: hypothetical protein RIQ79_2308 [Verrucomicrobiota bacterium]